ncbi:MAG: Na/Pi cotransporter family protein [Firmicutes bacterium]|nr:Na/Pi cotransporter family protein [Bacillota bacterium]
MTVFSVFSLLGGLAFFIFGMNQMSASLERIAGPRMENIIDKMTKNRFAGLAMGCIITIAVQSSSAVTVMLVGLVNSGLMDITNTVGVIMGSNIGTTITAWFMSLIGISGENVFVRMLKPESFSPVLAFIGIILIMIAKAQKKKDVGNAFLGFAILMYGMILMSGSVSPLAESPSFSKVLTAFQNPLIGILIGLAVTAIIQSSAASVGMLQALSMSGGITYGMAIPIIMGQNIGTCATALLSSIGVNRNAKRVAVIHLSFNLIGTAVFLIGFYVLHIIIDFAFLDTNIKPAGIALCHTIFNVMTTALLLPFTGQLVKIAKRLVKVEEPVQVAYLDERLFEVPPVVVSKCSLFAKEMAEKTGEAVKKAIDSFALFSDEKADSIVNLEKEIDVYEDHLGAYLTKIAGTDLSDEDNRTVALILHSIGNFERISDHALNLLESVRELKDKKLLLSDQGQEELDSVGRAVSEIVDITINAYKNVDAALAEKIEPLEQVIDILTETIKINHIERLKRGECTVERGFVLSDVLNNYERISDHCSNIGVAVIGAETENYDSHEYLSKIKTMDNPRFKELFSQYREKYSVSQI